jgi:hypothetical protein
MQQAVVRILKAGTLYFALVFGAGFVLGPIRILWAVPRFGTRMAELVETPLMLVVTILAPGGLFGVSLSRPKRQAGLVWAASALASCWSRSLGLCSGFGVYRSVSILQAGTLCREQSTT